MSKKEDLLLLAIGEIDDDLIEEANEPYRKSKFWNTRAFATIAASLLVVIGIIAGSRLFDIPLFDMNAGGNASPPGGGDFGGGVGSGDEGSEDGSNETTGDDGLHNPITSITINDGSLSLTDSGGYRYVFTLTLTSEIERIDAIFTMYLGSEEFIVATDGADLDGKSSIGTPRLYVDDVLSLSIPRTPGTYEISFDLSEYTDAGYSVGNRILISPFGYFDTIALLY